MALLVRRSLGELHGSGGWGKSNGRPAIAMPAITGVSTSKALKKFVRGQICRYGERDERIDMGGSASAVFTVLFKLPSIPWTGFLRSCHKSCGTNDIIGGGRQHEMPSGRGPSTITSLARPADGLFDPLTVDRAGTKIGVAGVAAVNVRLALRIALRDMRRVVTFAAASPEVGHIVVLVADRRAVALGIMRNYVERGLALCRVVGQCHPRIPYKLVVVFRHQISSLTGLALLTRPIEQQPGRGVSGRDLCIVLAYLAMEVALGIETAAATLAVRGRVDIAFPRKAVRAAVRFQQRIDGERLAGEPTFYQLIHKLLGRDNFVERPISVITADCFFSYWIIGRQLDEPAEQKITVSYSRNAAPSSPCRALAIAAPKRLPLYRHDFHSSLLAVKPFANGR